MPENLQKLEEDDLDIIVRIFTDKYDDFFITDFE